jgi:hypothetical protein
MCAYGDTCSKLFPSAPKLPHRFSTSLPPFKIHLRATHDMEVYVVTTGLIIAADPCRNQKRKASDADGVPEPETGLASKRAKAVHIAGVSRFFDLPSG